jgi:hypothetical protein
MMREDLVGLCYKSKQIANLDLQLFKIYSGLRTFAGIKYEFLINCFVYHSFIIFLKK